MNMTFERSADTESVVDILRGVNLEISYKQLAQQASLTTRRTMSVLASARRILKKEKVLFGVNRGIGLHRLSDTDKVKLPEYSKKRIFRETGRAIGNLNTISEFEALSQTDRHSVVTNKTILNVIRSQAQVKPEPPKIKTAPQPMANVAKLIKK